MAERRTARGRNVTIKLLLMVGLLTITVFSFPRGDVYEATVDIGDTWQRATLSAPFDFPIYKSNEVLETERAGVRFATKPIFVEDVEALNRMQENFDIVTQQLDEVFAVYRRYSDSIRMTWMADSTQSPEFSNKARLDSVQYLDLRRNARVKLSEDQWEWLAGNAAAVVAYAPDPKIYDNGYERALGEGILLYRAILNFVLSESKRLHARGVLSIPHDSIFTDDIVVRNERASTYKEPLKYNYFSIDQAYDLAQEKVESMGFQPYSLQEMGDIPKKFTQAFFVPSLRYDHTATMRSWQNAERDISPTYGKVAADEVIVREDQVITPEIKQKLISLESGRGETSVESGAWMMTLGQVVLAGSVFTIFFLYLFMARRKVFESNRKILLIVLLYVGIIGLFAVAIRVDTAVRADVDVMYAVPVVIVSVLLAIIFDSRVGLFGTLTLALIGGMILDYNLEYVYATLLAGSLSVFGLRDAKNRSQFFLSASFAFIGYVVAMGGAALLEENSIDQLGSEVLAAGVSSFLLIIAYPLLWVVERTFGITTDITLLELQNTDRPLLKKLNSLSTQGTHNHSKQVANLAAAGAAAVGANALLTTVGALYHDIGKISQPGYFVENQTSDSNPHDKLTPHKSAEIIRNHVNEGIDLGRKHRLPECIIDFIPAHHGTTRIEYFYDLAVKGHKEGDPPLLEEDFRYQGPLPQTKETAILMLADGVEAATRSLPEPIRERMEEEVDRIFKLRMEDGQLDDAPLTLGDLQIIKKTFLSELSGFYHTRNPYPEQPAE